MAKKEQEEALRQRVLELQDEVIRLQDQVDFLEKHTDTAFCSICPNACNRDKITCGLCKTLKPPAPEFSADGMTRLERKKVYICSLKGDGTAETIKGDWVKAREYSSRAYRDGYQPMAPYLYLTTFADATDAADMREVQAQAIEWLFEVYVSEGEFWICTDPAGSKIMTKEIHLAEALGMTILYRYDYPEAVGEPPKLLRPEWARQPVPEAPAEQPAPEAPASAETPQEVAEPAKEKQPVSDEKRKGQVEWAKQQIAKATDPESVKRVKNWAAKHLAPADLGNINYLAGEKIKSLKNAA